MYIHGLSGYTMSIHTCMITGSENVYTAFGNQDPCEEEVERHCDETSTHFEQADCCNLQQTVVSVDDDSNISSFQISNIPFLLNTCSLNLVLFSRRNESVSPVGNLSFPDPPDLSEIRVFRI